MNDKPDTCEDECVTAPKPLKHPDKGFDAMKTKTAVGYSSSGKRVIATKTEYGASTVSQEEADQKALELAQSRAEELLALKLLVQSYINGYGDDNNKFIVPNSENKEKQKWEGVISKKPWDYRVTVMIPHLETIEPLWMAVQLIRKQTERPYIMVVDTGSSKRTVEFLERMRAPDLEIHYIRSNAYRHPSQPVPVAMDLVHSLCSTEYILHTHSDVFFTRDNLIHDLLSQCSKDCPAVGYRMSPRGWITDEWEYMLGHTLAMLHLPTIERTGASWSIERVYRSDPALVESYKRVGGWPDTETGWNRVMKANGIAPKFIGEDRNYERQVDGNIDHVRSYPGSRMYSDEYFKKAEGWMLDAIKDGLRRLGILR